MNQTEFASALAQRGCVGYEKTFCGTYNNYPLSMIYRNANKNGSTTFNLIMQFEQNVPIKMIRGIIREMRGQAKITRLSTESRQMHLAVVTKRDTNALPAIDALLAHAVQSAAQFSLTVPQSCPICRTGGCDSYALAKGTYRPVHAACVQATSAKQQANFSKNQRTGSYATGIIGAILGGIIGAVPNLISVIGFNFITAWLCLLVPLGAFYGYKLFRGKMNRAAFFVVLLVAILMVPVMSYLSFASTILEQLELNLFFSPSGLLKLANRYTEVMRVAMDILGKTALFTGIGFLFTLGVITRTGLDDAKIATFSTASLRPIDGVAQPTLQAQPVISTFQEP